MGQVFKGLRFIFLVRQAALVGSSLKDMSGPPGRLLLAFQISRQRLSQEGQEV